MGSADKTEPRARVLRRVLTKGASSSAILVLGLAAAACTHKPFESQTLHYATFKVPQPTGNVVHVCHAYGCQKKTRVRFDAATLAEIKSLMDKTRRADTPAEERRAVAYAIGWIERYVGMKIGTSADRAGMDFAGSGDPTQQDCVDEATNTTSYLNVIASNGFLRHHTVGVPFAKENYLNGIAGWTHWTAVLHETSTGETWAVDSWIYANGENPAIVEASQWYISDLDSLPASTR
ncbi:MAG: hypothetical protein ACFCUN_05075 [Hyphomicrobiaceae bacterium]